MFSYFCYYSFLLLWIPYHYKALGGLIVMVGLVGALGDSVERRGVRTCGKRVFPLYFYLFTTLARDAQCGTFLVRLFMVFFQYKIPNYIQFRVIYLILGCYWKPIQILKKCHFFLPCSLLSNIYSHWFWLEYIWIIIKLL